MKQKWIISSSDDSLSDATADDLSDAWAQYELGDDCCYLSASRLEDGFIEGKWPSLKEYLDATNIPLEDILLNYWW